MIQTIPQQAFGLHLTVDAYGCDRQRLTDLDGIHCFLDAFPGLIGMTRIMPPYVFKYRGKVPGGWGLSGFVLIAESHISIHTFPDRGFLSLDIFSCKWFDGDLALSVAREEFKFQKHEMTLLNRGLEYPRDIGRAKRLLERERLDVNRSGSDVATS